MEIRNYILLLCLVHSRFDVLGWKLILLVPHDTSMQRLMLHNHVMAKIGVLNKTLSTG